VLVLSSTASTYYIALGEEGSICQLRKAPRGFLYNSLSKVWYGIMSSWVPEIAEPFEIIGADHLHFVSSSEIMSFVYYTSDIYISSA
jgi:hypothetical protein